MSILPPKAFWRAALQKLISLMISLKVWILATATALLAVGLIGEMSWVTIFTSIAVARVGIQAITTYKGEAKPLSHTPDDNVID